MKILLVSNFYYNRGGDCTYLFALKNLLEKKGHEICLFSMHHPLNFDSRFSDYFVSYINYDEEVKSKNMGSGVKVLNRTIYSLEAQRNIEKLVQKEKPDIVHMQNIHHHITPSILYVFRKYNIPVVWTLHDFTLICPNTSFISHGKICERCRKKKYFWPLIERCKKNSFGASAIAAFETMTHRIMKINDMVDIFIAPSQFLKNKLKEYGFPENKIVHIKNFVCGTDNKSGERHNEDYYLFAGRLSEEKGVKTLIDAALKVNSCKLKIVGSGPLEHEMISYVKSRNAEHIIDFLGYRDHSSVMKLLRNCRFAVSPSECYENFPFSVIEAFSCGKPVIGTRIGGIPEIIHNWETGMLFEFGDADELSLKIKFLINHPEVAQNMGEKAREMVDEEMNVEKHYDVLMKTYNELISLKNKR